MAFSGLRPESLGDFLGEDGLKVNGLPEMIVRGDGMIEFADSDACHSQTKSLKGKASIFHVSS